MCIYPSFRVILQIVFKKKNDNKLPSDGISLLVEDLERNDGSAERPYLMPESLRKVLNKKNKSQPAAAEWVTEWTNHGTVWVSGEVAAPAGFSQQRAPPDHLSSSEWLFEFSSLRKKIATMPFGWVRTVGNSNIEDLDETFFFFNSMQCFCNIKDVFYWKVWSAVDNI